ncbi:hypothetical protein [Dehalobacter restrictus]|uniref:Uncharacterized protein n=1 Tax=Dehalobacter restrictus TaxID=55583 RepID=A0A857DGT4_9FIRM|nr:hypothetical protein [Dehalobacter restrictus]QHA00524.1 hypothetical protein GQ588_07720 [Dehalobacter restrictus]
MENLINVLTNLINTFISVITGGLGLANFYSSNWGKYLVYALLIFVAAKIFKVNLKLDVKKGRG